MIDYIILKVFPKEVLEETSTILKKQKQRRIKLFLENIPKTLFKQLNLAPGKGFEPLRLQGATGSRVWLTSFSLGECPAHFHSATPCRASLSLAAESSPRRLQWKEHLRV